MTSKQVALDVTAFLDSPEARALSGVRPSDLRRLTETFVELCYGQVDKAPRFLDAEDMRTLLTRLLPARLSSKDPLAPHVPAVLAAYLDHLSTAQVVSQLFELRRALEATSTEFLEAVDSGRFTQQIASPKPAPFAHGAPKLGRNDPCSCGSGRKFKQCHGKSA